MNAKKGNRILIVLIGILTVLLLGLGGYTFQFYNQTREDISVLKEKKTELKAELEELMAKYEKAISKNKTMEEQLKQAKNHIQTLIDSLENIEFSYAQLRNYRNQIDILKSKNQNLFAVIDSLSTRAESLQQEIDSTKIKLAKQGEFTDSLLLNNKKLQKKVLRASELQIVQSTSDAVKILSSGQVENTKNSNRSEKIEVCFTLGKNELAETGKRDFYIQIINPENTLLGMQKSVKFGEKVLRYSKQVDVYYKNKIIKTCSFIDAKKDDLIPGRYIVNIFLKAELLSSKVIYLE